MVLPMYVNLLAFIIDALITFIFAARGPIPFFSALELTLLYFIHLLCRVLLSLNLV